MRPAQTRIPLRVVFYEEGGYCVAHCLEFNLMGHGKTKEEALHLLTDAITLQLESTVEHNNLNNLLTSADKEYETMFYQGEDIAEGELQIKFAPIHKDNIVVDAPMDRLRVYRERQSPLQLA